MLNSFTSLHADSYVQFNREALCTHMQETQSADMPRARDSHTHACASEMSFLPAVVGVIKTLVLRQSHSSCPVPTQANLTSTVPSLGQALVTFPEGGISCLVQASSVGVSQFGGCLPSSTQRPLWNQEVSGNPKGCVADCGIPALPYHCEQVSAE